ncbi:hypothetical protein ACO2FA_13510 [Staphylococcus warneri]
MNQHIHLVLRQYKVTMNLKDIAMDPSAGGYAFGFAQWDSERRVNLLKFAKRRKNGMTLVFNLTICLIMIRQIQMSLKNY